MASFDEKAAEWDTTERVERARALADVVRRNVPLQSSMRMVEIGAGTGLLGLDLLADVASVLLTDPSPGMLDIARSKIEAADVADADTIVYDIPGDLPFPDAAFDGVLCWYSLIHLTDDELPVALAEVARVLRPGGLVLVAFQKGEGTWDVGTGLRERGHDVELVRFPRSPKVMLDALASAGFGKEARLVREPLGAEKQGQAFVIARRLRGPAVPG